MFKQNVIVSIITPTYNRGNLLVKCYESLREQTSLEFEWIIVDDGSIDNTSEIVKDFPTDKFPITYIYKKNCGKHLALNETHDYIHGQYILILDSDDYLTCDAIETVIRNWEKYRENAEIGVLVFLRGEDVNTPLCKAKDEDENKIVDLVRYRRVKIVSGDACEVIRTSEFLKYPFPDFQGEKFVAENALWSRVALTHKCVYINKVIYICHYLDGGLTDSGRRMRLKNPQGGMYTSNLEMHKRNYFSHRVKNGLLFVCYGFFSGKKIREFAKECDWKVLMYFCLPVGWCIYQIWRKKYIEL